MSMCVICIQQTMAILLYYSYYLFYTVSQKNRTATNNITSPIHNVY